MTSEGVAKDAIWAALPDEWPGDLTGEIRRRLSERGDRLVVLDDDPTGAQTVHDVPVLTEWDVETLAEELARSPVFYILTNSRSLSEAQATALAGEVGGRLAQAAERSGRAYVLASRSDSTLRGHYPAEVEALEEAVGGGFDGVIFAPFFEEGGRFTIDDVHYVQQGERLVRASETEFARDAQFGYRHDNLREFIEEKTGGRVTAEAVVSLSLDDVRRGGPTVVAEKLALVRDGGVAIVNAASYRDLDVVVAGVLAAEEAGKRFLYRCAASFVRARGGIAARPLLGAAELAQSTEAGGLLVVGSHVGKTTEQLAEARRALDLHAIELDVDAVAEAEGRRVVVERIAAEVNAALAGGADVALFTDRTFVERGDASEAAALASGISEALSAIVRGLSVRPRFLVAKGGTTASEIATAGLGVRRAMVLGQILPGVPVWQLGPETRYPEMPYVVFPGNVGEADSVAKCLSLLGGR
jgi:uncharacterized protein YgbK (DUF1537 family)